MLYQVKVTQQGIFLAIHIIEAPDALTAIDLVEREYNEPLEIKFGSIEDEHSRSHPVMAVNNWHGYMFTARAIRGAFCI
jgi:hypothetical protein